MTFVITYDVCHKFVLTRLVRTVMASRRLVLRRVLARKVFRRERVFRDRINPLERYDDRELIDRYRFRRVDILWLTELIGDDIDHPLPRQGSLPPVLQLCIALQYYATGSFYVLIGDLHGVSERTVGRVVDRVSRALAGKVDDFVRLPTQGEADTAMVSFYQRGGFPNVWGAIDCTQIPIVCPNEFESVYTNRFGEYSINVQLVCNHELIIVNCAVRWPGSVNDARILKESCLHHFLELVPRPLAG